LSDKGKEKHISSNLENVFETNEKLNNAEFDKEIVRTLEEMLQMTKPIKSKTKSSLECKWVTQNINDADLF
jgi:uncharacterized protein YfeS